MQSNVTPSFRARTKGQTPLVYGAHNFASRAGSGGHWLGDMSKCDARKFIVSYSSDLKLDPRGIYTDGGTYALLPCDVGARPSGDRIPYDITPVRDDEIVRCPGPYAGAFNTRMVRLAADGTLLEACNSGAHVTFKLYSCIKECRMLWSCTVAGRVRSADDMRHNRHHIAFVNSSSSSRFAGVCFFKLDPLNRQSQDPRVSMGYFPVCVSAKLSWGDPQGRLLVVTVPDSKAVLCVDLMRVATPELACPFVVVPNINPLNRDQIALASELSTTLEFAHGVYEVLGGEDNEPSFAKLINDDVYNATRLSIESLSRFPMSSSEAVHYAADGGFMYVISNRNGSYRISKFRLPRDGVADVAVTPSVMHDLKGPAGVSWFIDLKRTQIKHLGTEGSAVLFVLQGRAGGAPYVSLLWFNDADQVEQYTYRGESATAILPSKLVRLKSTSAGTTIMTDKGSFIVRYSGKRARRQSR